MIDAAIHSGDLLVVDRSLEVKSNNIVIASIDDDLTVKRIKVKDDKYYLLPENVDYDPIPIRKHMDFTIWGVVTHVIHKV